MNQIPIIDISALFDEDLKARRAVAALIGAACRGTGFFAITGHRVPRRLVEQTFAASALFFSQPAATKQKLEIGKLGSNRGYVGMGVETLDENAAADHKEALNLIWTDNRTRPPNVWPALPDFERPVQQYFDAVLAVGRLLHHAFALDLDLPESFFDDKIDAPLATLRMLHYPAAHHTDPQGRIGAGTHTDYGNITLLATDAVAGLEIRNRDGLWIKPPTLPDAFLCNIGDCLMRWTNDVYTSTPHRVLKPEAERYSIALFLDPNPDALVSAIPSCVVVGSESSYPPILTRDYLKQRFESTYGG